MPLVDDNPGPRAPEFTPEQAPPELTDAWGAAFRSQNSVVSLATSVARSGPRGEPVEGYTALPMLKELQRLGTGKYLEQYSDEFAGLHNDTETYAKIAEINSRENDNRQLDAVPGGSLARMVAGSLDPTMAIPGGEAVTAARAGTAIAKSAVRLGAAAAIQSGAQETILRTTQAGTRPLEESVMNVGTATLMTALIGTAAARVLTPVERTRAIAAMQRLRDETNAHAAGAAAPVEETIASAAVRAPDGTIFPGANHGEAAAAADAAGHKMEALLGSDGFVTSTGRYVDRKEAMTIADRAGQVKEKIGGASDAYLTAHQLQEPADSIVPPAMKAWPDRFLDPETIHAFEVQFSSRNKASVAVPQGFAEALQELGPPFVHQDGRLTEEGLDALRAEAARRRAPAPPELGEETTPELGGAPMAAAAGAAATDTRLIESVPALPRAITAGASAITGALERVPFFGPPVGRALRGAAGLLEQSNPLSRNLAARALSVRRVTADAFEIPTLLEQNIAGITTTLHGGAALEREAKQIIQKTQIAVGDELQKQWEDWRFKGMEPPVAAKFRDAVRGAFGKGEGRTFEDFKAMVDDANRNDDTHDIPQVQAAAQFIRREVYDPWLKRAQDAGLIKPDIDVKTAKSYAQRLWNKQAIAANRPAFADKIANWLDGEQTVKRAAQDRIRFLNDNLQGTEQSLTRLNNRLTNLDANAAKLQARLEERAMEVERAETRADLMEQRATLLAEGISETEQFIAQMRKEVTSPEMRERLDIMARDAADLRRADKPMTEAQLQAVEAEELKGILTGPTRLAAEMLVGRRKYQESPSFMRWIVANGGVNDVGGELRGLKPGVVNKEGRGRSPDEFGELIADQFSSHFPPQDIPGGGRPEANTVLNWIQEADQGIEPPWWREHWDSVNREEVNATHIARGLDQVFNEAGIKVRKISDVAKILRDGGGQGVTLRDLDKIARDMEAAGASIPPSVGRQEGEEAHAATLEDIAAARRAIESAQQRSASLDRRLLAAGAAEREAGVPVTASRGRLGILEDRQARMEAKRELLADAVALAEQNRDRMRERIEGEIEKWEGTSGKQAVSAIKARRKYEAERNPEETGRIEGADATVDAAVNRILDKDTSLSLEEHRNLADQIINHIMGSPDGRLPYDEKDGGPEVGWGAPGYTEPPRGPLANRDFNIPDAEVRDFLEHDVEHIVNAHMRTMAPDVMLAERFGDTRMSEAFRKIEDEYSELIRQAPNEKERIALGKERDAALRDTAGMRDRVRGVYGFTTYALMPTAARVAAAMKNFNVLTNMGMAAVSSLPDLAGPVFRYGLGTVFKDAYEPFIRSLMSDSGALPVEAYRQLRAMGVAIDMTLSARHHSLSDIITEYRPQSRTERTLQFGADKFQFANALGPWTDVAKTIAGTVAMQEIYLASKAAAAGTATARELRLLGENNIPSHAYERIAQQYEKHGNEVSGVKLSNSAEWTDEEAKRIFEGAVGRETDIAVVTPGQEKPLILSNPVLSPLFQFKSFVAGSSQRILIANLQRSDSQALQGLLFSLGLGMMSYKVNALLGGQPTSDNPADWIKEAASRGNVFGWLEETNALASKATRGQVDMYRTIGAGKPLSRYAGRSLMDQLLGPTAGKVESGAQVLGAGFSRDWNNSDTKAVRRVTVGQNLFWLRNVFNAVEDGFNNAFGIKPKQ